MTATKRRRKPPDRWGDEEAFGPYVPAKERRERAREAIENLRAAGREMWPVIAEGREVASTFWGIAWCQNLERYSDYANRLPRGRSYLRNGSVIDLRITRGHVSALVSGGRVYHVNVRITPVKADKWKAIRRRSVGEIDSVVELLQGRLSKGVMEHLCQQETGLFPTPREIRFSCTCPDAAYMCKHVAAVLYGVGARLDEKPELLFRLRGVDEQELIAGAVNGIPLSTRPPAPGRALDPRLLKDLFGEDVE